MKRQYSETSNLDPNSNNSLVINDESRTRKKKKKHKLPKSDPVEEKSYCYDTDDNDHCESPLEA